MVSFNESSHDPVMFGGKSMTLNKNYQNNSLATLVGKFRYSRDWWPVPKIVVVVAWWPTLSSPSKSCTLSEHLTPDSINLGGDLAAHIKSSL